jgi:hypothetical protein
MTSEYKARVAAVRAKAPGVELLTKEDALKIEGMYDGVLRSARSYVEEIKTEASFFFEINGVACKSRLDGFSPSKKRIVELKTTRCAEPSAFARDAKYYAYAVQMAWQGLAVTRCLGWTPSEYIIVAVESSEPYCATVHSISLAWIAEMEEACLNYVEEYKAVSALRPDQVPGYPGGVNIIDFSKGDA